MNITARMAQLLERMRKDLVIFTSRIWIPLWDVGAGPSDETVETEVPCRSRCWHEKEPSLLKAMSAKHKSKFAAQSLVMVTAAR
jgi:hypothetical protein